MARKIAILGGGASSLFAAWELVHSDPAAYDITVYQVGWRLGGKGASGRRGSDKRIEEHGLHLMFGFYENVFRVIREAYAEHYRDPELWRQFFKCDDTAVSMIRFLNAARTQWRPWQVPYPASDDRRTPGDGGDATTGSTVFAVMRNAMRWIAGLIRGAIAARGTHALVVEPEAVADQITLDELREAIDELARPKPGLESLGWMPAYWDIARRFVELLMPRLPDPAHADQDRGRFDKLVRYVGEVCDRLWSGASDELLAVVRFVLAVLRGLFIDLLLRGSSDWFELDRYDLRAWLRRHGGDPAAPPVDGLYDAVFASYSELGAGAILQAALKAAFLFKGSAIYKMQAGMGDTIFTPLYLALKARNVKFRFFHRVEALAPSGDGQFVESITFDRQAAVDDYDPLIDVEVDIGGRRTLKCWPSEPIWDRLPAAERTRIRDRDRLDLENHWTPPAADREVTIRRGSEFDDVILGISVAALPELCDELLARDPPFADHVLRLARATTATQAMQLWTVPGRPLLPPRSIVVPNTDPYDTIADMSHLVAAENHPAGQVGGVYYLCSALLEASPPAPRSLTSYPEELARVAIRNGRSWVAERAPILSRTPAGAPAFDWTALYDPGEAVGAARFDAQYVNTPRNLSDRYVLATPQTHGFRLLANGTRYANLYLTGDWIKTSLSIGCLEAAAMAGIQAARALSLETGNRAVPRARGDWIEDVRPRTATGVALVRAGATPHYRHRDGELIVPPPYQVACDGLFLFVLRADPRRLQALCDRELNLGPRYRPWGDFVVLYGATLDNRSTGISARAGEVGVWLPVVRADDAAIRVYSPYVWLDSATSTIAGRMVYGYAKQTAEVVLPAPGSPVMSVTGDAVITGPDGRSIVQRTRLVTASLAGTGAWAPASRPQPWLELVPRVAAALLASPGEMLGMLDGMKSVFLKQLAGAAGTAPAYQAIIEAGITPKLDTVSGHWLDGAWTIRLPAHHEPNPVDRLGLEATPTFGPDLLRASILLPIAQLWMKFEGSIDPGVEVFRAPLSPAGG